jgi:hypothetical protein
MLARSLKRIAAKMSGGTTTAASASIPLSVQYSGQMARVPTLEDYKRPEKAPLPGNLKRTDFHKFMMGKPDKYPIELKTYGLAFILVFWIIGLATFTFNKLKPDDFEWIEEQRNKAEAYKQRQEQRGSGDEKVGSANNNSNSL